ncbi:hypothetical protein [Pontibacter pamirensis]|uniref:hypothetical protein n=1 Tax=Pontibacter pamirensis TaxID=2562824 RepID=UPI001389BF65|nr:hypothetical protein [Pontibacter pamirensis]
MKLALAVLLAAFLASCNQVNEHKLSTNEPLPAPVVQELVVDSSSISLTQAQTSYHERSLRVIETNGMIGSKTLQEHLDDPLIPVLFKDVFQEKVALDDDDKTLSLIDSLFSNDRVRHPFYFTLVTKTLWWADGAFSEPLGISMKEYVETEPKQFITYFQSEPVLTEADFNKWADGVAMEVGIKYEHSEIEEIDGVESRMLSNCRKCDAEERNMIQRFAKRMKEYYP